MNDECRSKVLYHYICEKNKLARIAFGDIGASAAFARAIQYIDIRNSLFDIRYFLGPLLWTTHNQ
jgi:hypothetical protein